MIAESSYIPGQGACHTLAPSTVSVTALVSEAHYPENCVETLVLACPLLSIASVPFQHGNPNAHSGTSCVGKFTEVGRGPAITSVAKFLMCEDGPH